MRFSFSGLISVSAALMLCGCAEENAAMKAHQNAVSGNRQEVALRLAYATETTGNYAEAETLFRQAADRAPNDAGPHRELAAFYRRHHEDGKAVAALKDALKIQPSNTDIARELANTYIGLGEGESALPVLNRAIAINGKDPLLYNSRGVALDQTGDYSEAQASYNQAYALDSVGGTTYKINISMSYILSGAYDRAIRLLRPMLDEPDAPPIVRQNLALAYGLKGDSKSALELGLQDLSTSEAEENLRFYRMLAHNHSASGNRHADNAAVPASVVKELFPEGEASVPSANPVPQPEMPEQEDSTPGATPAAPLSDSAKSIILPEPILKPESH